MNDLTDHPLPGVRVLLVLRREYESQLSEAGLPDVHAGVNRFEIGRFTHQAASGFLTDAQLGLAQDALEALLASAAAMDGTPGLIRPITLNVLGHVISEGKQSAMTSLDAGELVRGYITQVIDHPAIRSFSRPVLEHLVTSQETKQPKSVTALMQNTGLKHGEVRAVLNVLTEAGLARPLDRANDLWELSHDFVARAVSRQLGRQQRKMWGLVAAYASPALLATVLTAWGVYEILVIRPEQILRQPVDHPADYWVSIKPGSFCMGSRKDKKDPVVGDCSASPFDPEAQENEKPLHRVEIKKPFLLAKYEVTIEEYEHFINDTKGVKPDRSGFGKALTETDRNHLPVINVGWDDAQAYADWLTQKTGKTHRLPSEAEWEYAARAGTNTPYFWKEDKRPEQYAWFASNSDGTPHPVTSELQPGVDAKLANPWGLYAMAGNVWEWTQDCYHDTYLGAPTDGKPWQDAGGCDSGRRVIRGGSWFNGPAYLRAAFRDPGTSRPSRYFSLGFRLAQDP